MAHRQIVLDTETTGLNYKTGDRIIEVAKIIDSKYNNIVFSCGSGVTACVLALAYSLVNNKYSPTIYDGSWAEYGKI